MDGKRSRVRLVCDRRRLVDDCKDTLACGYERLDLRSEPQHPTDRVQELIEVCQEYDQIADGYAVRHWTQELVAIDQVSAVAEDYPASQGEDYLNRERIEFLLPMEPHGGSDAAIDRPREAPRLRCFSTKRLDKPDQLYSLLHG